jgi:hypothetical protein
MNKTLIKLLAVAGVVTGLSACGPGPESTQSETGPVAPVANIAWGTTEKFASWVDQGGLAKLQNNLLMGARVTAVDIDYLQPGPGILQAHIKVFGTPAETRAATAEICNASASQFVTATDSVPSGRVTRLVNQREYTCYYENTNGRGNIVITSRGITVDPLASTRAPGYEN